MVTVNNDPRAGGNVDQPDDGRDGDGRLPEPLDAARFPHEAMDLPGMPASQPAGTGPVLSTPPPADGAPEEGGNVEQPDAEVNDAGELAGPVAAQDFPDAAPPARGGRVRSKIGLDKSGSAEANATSGDSGK